MSTIKLTNSVLLSQESMVFAVDGSNLLATITSNTGDVSSTWTVPQTCFVISNSTTQSIQYYGTSSSVQVCFQGSYFQGVFRKGDKIRCNASAYNNQGQFIAYGLK